MVLSDQDSDDFNPSNVGSHHLHECGAPNIGPKLLFATTQTLAGGSGTLLSQALLVFKWAVRGQSGFLVAGS